MWRGSRLRDGSLSDGAGRSEMARAGVPVSVRLTPIEKATYEGLAAGRGQPLGAWMRQALAEAALLEQALARQAEAENADSVLSRRDPSGSRPHPDRTSRRDAQDSQGSQGAPTAARSLRGRRLRERLYRLTDRAMAAGLREIETTANA